MRFLSVLSAVTLNHSLTLKDPRLPGGKVTGKVIAYKFILDGQKGENLAWVTLGVSVGTGVKITKPSSKGEEYCESYFEKEDLNNSPSGICFEIPTGQYPANGLTKTGRLSEYDIIREIKVFNPADEQERRLIHQQPPYSLDTQKVLQDHPTDIQIKLLDLKTSECLLNDLAINVLTTWSAPQQIDLAAPTNKEEV